MDYDVCVPTVRRLNGSENFVVLGRYRGSGTALVSLNGRSVQVRFPDAREAAPPSSLLWASARIETLSSSDVNQKAVMALSKRFGIPSKWTSWLAIPEEERRNFKRQMWASDRADAAKAYAQAVSRGDQSAMKTQKIAFEDLSKKLGDDGPNYAANEELQPLASYLNDELRQVQSAQLQAKYDSKISRSQQAQWAVFEKNLRNAGATDGGAGVDLPVYVVEDELRIASRLFLQEIEAGRKDGASARKFQARLKELAATKTARQYGWSETTFLGEQAEMRANALAMDIATQRASDKPDRKRELQAQAQLARLNGEGQVDATQVLQSALRQVWGQKIEVATRKWATEIEAGRASGSAGPKICARSARPSKAVGVDRRSRRGFGWHNLTQAVATRHVDSIRAQGMDGESARVMETEVARIAGQSGLKTGDLQKVAWSAVANRIGNEMATQLRAAGKETPATKMLQSQLDDLAGQHQTQTASDYASSAWRSIAEDTSKSWQVKFWPRARTARRRAHLRRRWTKRTNSRASRRLMFRGQSEMRGAAAPTTSPTKWRRRCWKPMRLRPK